MKWLVAATLVVAGVAHADPPCGVVEVRFQPGAQDLQMVVWIEDASGNYVDTPYITRSVGTFGLANRAGAPLLKTNYHWIYGARDMVFPVWAHRRNHHYPKVVMGGCCGNDVSSVCPANCAYANSSCSGDCDNTTIAYHSLVSTSEPFYCQPQASPLDTSNPVPIDVMSCASRGTFSKGAYANPPAFSLYPPRADLTSMNPKIDSQDVLDYANQNDLVAVSAATPLPGALVSPPVFWQPINQPAGDYVAWIEVSQEYDWTPGHNPEYCTKYCNNCPGYPTTCPQPDHLNQVDPHGEWDFEGHQFLGQPAILYKVPFHYDGFGSSEVATQFAGYATWDNSDGNLHAPDGSIVTNVNGSGAGRIIDVNDGVDVYRMKVVVGVCDGGVLPIIDGGIPDMRGGMETDAGTIAVPNCPVPNPVTNLQLTPGDKKIDLTFDQAANGPTPAYFAVHYREGNTPIAGAVFEQQNAGPSVNPGAPGAPLAGTVDQLMSATSYGVAVRAVTACGSKSAVVSKVAQVPLHQFATLHGCFIATAAFGSPMMAQVAALRKFRDTRMVTNSIGQLATAIYYSFSPPFARVIASDENLRALARRALSPIVAIVTR
jgi:hypothetical protein